MKPNFVGQIRITTTDTSLEVEWDAPYRGVDPDEYVVGLRNARGKMIKSTRRVVDANDEQKVSYDGLEAGSVVRVAVRGKTGGERGRWLVTTVVLGDNPPALPDSHYMYQVAAGEEIPEDAIGAPTRHVRLENGIWTPYNPGREYKTNAMWWWYDLLDQNEDNVVKAKAELDEWLEANPDVEYQHPVLQVRYDHAVQAVEATHVSIAKEEAKVDAEIAVRYPPENLTIDDVRWVQRPKRYATPRN